MGCLRGEGLVALEHRHLTTSFTADASSLLSSHAPDTDNSGGFFVEGVGVKVER